MAAEKNFENEVKSFLQSIGIYPLGTPSNKMKTKMIGYYEKRWGNAYTGSGLPDLHIVVNGLSVEVELKAENGKLSDLQKFKLLQINTSGAIGFALYPKDFEAFKKFMNAIKKVKINYRGYSDGEIIYDL